MLFKAEEDKKVRVQITLTPQLIKRIEEAGKSYGSTRSEIIRCAVHEYLKKYFENE